MSPSSPNLRESPCESLSEPKTEFGLGAVVICGGKSSRVGIDKSRLVIQGETFLKRIVRLLTSVTDPIVVVGNRNTRFPDFASNVRTCHDRRLDAGPLEGIRVGLAALEPSTEFAFVTSCDAPLLSHRLIRILREQIKDADAIIPVDEQRAYGLQAVYRTNFHNTLDHRLETRQLRVADLAELPNVQTIRTEELRSADPELDSFLNINSPEDYLALLKRFGEECPVEIFRSLNK